ncbi:5,10-methylenetetrahydrofolate reductase [Roseovarius sp. EC-HK134]|jgi:methylenetetrahydrofolate reductase (NADPH)|uniref:Methylenetetrahydrofolate reductase n=1 Tax=Roseovarius mucosus TaxID=215743 RepID=A0A1V0RLF6_9RHOB|nr:MULTISPECIES: methylenetetrahydrofolate reductase [NAD(P)H] [Roseovarius]MBS4009529.1 methylenetetrahydrofolate reductase [NAD(P)H] [Roseovarius sp.]ARE82608.1 5,10-methylenetetrahydrofolate reductase [Roseovarius mucosus]AWZ18770.1 5,10-methylenetetrahydrofolate reductase [Roseovarius sp. AK1035]EDM32418.1 5,10-methylenetetrahydrofolate reductase [Roseovarius sp. TM1035]VVT21962.1 5,10-methylenetetrahydrofolate reductase [Roseovarius sp. EC-SD190]|tara:strand:- start:37 stop:903 length:867 start_codon:yes stop_codon:yes gene_type:complete
MTTPRISFEFFPPKTLEASFRLWETIHALAPLDPRFVSVTYGAGGTTRELTREAVGTLHKATGLNVAAHLTCVDASRAETLEIADQFAAAGVSEIVALRGDPPKGSNGFVQHPDGFANSCELISALADTGKFTIRVGAYPEKHPEAADQRADIDWLKRKIDAGASEAITQFFFEAETFFRFRDACAAAGINAPIIPGILPIENWVGARKFALSCGTQVPAWLDEAFDKAIRDNRHDLLATALATELCSDLLDGGVEDLHFYTLNRPELTRDVCHALGVTPKVTLRDVA